MDKLKYFNAPNQEDLDEHFAWTPGWARCDTFPQVAIRYVGDTAPTWWNFYSSEIQEIDHQLTIP